MASAEAESIISKIKGKGKTAPAAKAESDEPEADAGSEAQRAACEDMFKILKGREPTSDEASAFAEAMDAYATARGY